MLGGPSRQKNSTLIEPDSCGLFNVRHYRTKYSQRKESIHVRTPPLLGLVSRWLFPIPHHMFPASSNSSQQRLAIRNHFFFGRSLLASDWLTLPEEIFADEIWCTEKEKKSFAPD